MRLWFNLFIPFIIQNVLLALLYSGTSISPHCLQFLVWLPHLNKVGQQLTYAFIIVIILREAMRLLPAGNVGNWDHNLNHAHYEGGREKFYNLMTCFGSHLNTEQLTAIIGYLPSILLLIILDLFYVNFMAVLIIHRENPFWVFYEHNSKIGNGQSCAELVLFWLSITTVVIKS